MSQASLLTDQARERAGMPEEWQWYSLQCMPLEGPTIYYEVKGCIAPLKTRGKYKGRRDFKNKQPGTDKTVYITVQDADAYVAAWEERTGLCASCGGEGKEMARCGVNIPTEYRDCRKCKGTGKAAAVAVAP